MKIKNSMWELRPVVGSSFIESVDANKTLHDVGIVANTVLVVQDTS
jgi:hypothetical protein